MKPARHRVQLGRVAAVALVAVFAGAGPAGPAEAATIGINGTVLIATADGGDDLLTATLSGSELDFFGLSFTVVTPGCSGEFSTVRCSLTGVTEVRIDMGTGDDVLDLSGVDTIAMPAGMPPMKFVALGGAGNDVLIASAGNVNEFWGGAGDDVLTGSATGASCLNGGDGQNVLIAGAGVGLPGASCNSSQPVFGPAQPVQVPEPHGLALVLSAFGMAGLARRRK
ncbi:PEP-CTERM sorting domain-containing protein [Roseateles cellulosilyticus]|uniref:PEP-CTERM protein-sorting domain-containing protein n=1 Tax=Pelomonas cellulosilytica TaxID=2906762 RepID=A0ABS8XWA2_9BURK|nr:PEP-CTERM sorting domain-containing protein [Pelomonas sp. P8]MCE4555498.1 hypothetical protein [Pelomonas sp. P8]